MKNLKAALVLAPFLMAGCASMPRNLDQTNLNRVNLNQINGFMGYPNEDKLIYLRIGQKGDMKEIGVYKEVFQDGAESLKYEGYMTPDLKFYPSKDSDISPSMLPHEDYSGDNLGYSS